MNQCFRILDIKWNSVAMISTWYQTWLGVLSGFEHIGMENRSYVNKTTNQFQKMSKSPDLFHMKNRPFAHPFPGWLTLYLGITAGTKIGHWNLEANCKLQHP